MAWKSLSRNSKPKTNCSKNWLLNSCKPAKSTTCNKELITYLNLCMKSFKLPGRWFTNRHAQKKEIRCSTVKTEWSRKVCFRTKFQSRGKRIFLRNRTRSELCHSQSLTKACHSPRRHLGCKTLHKSHWSSRISSLFKADNNCKMHWKFSLDISQRMTKWCKELRYPNLRRNCSRRDRKSSNCTKWQSSYIQSLRGWKRKETHCTRT